MVDPMNLGRGAMYSRMQHYSLQTHGLPDEEPAPNSGRDNQPQGNALSQVNGGAIYTRTQHYMLQTHSLPDKEPMPSTSGEKQRQVNAPNKISGGAIYTRTQRYTLQTHSLPDNEPMPGTSGENQQQTTEAEEQSDAVDRRKKRMPEKRAAETQTNPPAAGSNRGKKLKKASTNPSSATQHTARSDEAVPEELFVSALGTEDVNPWAGQREPEPERIAPVAADSTGWCRPDSECTATAAPPGHSRGALQQAGRSTALKMALVDCLDSLSGLDPNAAYKIQYVPPVPARLTLTRVEPHPLPPPPTLFPYGVPEGSQRCDRFRPAEAAAPERAEAPAEETRPDVRRPANRAGSLTPSLRPPSRSDVCPHWPERCIPMSWFREPPQPPVKHFKDAETNTVSTKECQTDFEETNNKESGKCCPLISANRVLLHHHAPKNRGQTSVLEVNHISADRPGPSNYSTPNGPRSARVVTPSSGVRPLGPLRPPAVSSPKRQQTPYIPCGDRTRERNSSESDSSSYSVTYSAPNSPETSYSSYPNTSGQREK